MITTNWVINQVFAFIGLILVVISFQQKDSKKLILIRNFATLSVFIGLCFLGNVSAIIFCGAGVLRNLVTLYFAYKPNTNKFYKYFSSVLLAILIIILNVIFWKNYFNLYSIVLGVVAIITFMQTEAATIRKMSVGAEILSIIYYALLKTPVNVVIEVLGLLSAIIGIIRLDRKKK